MPHDSHGMSYPGFEYAAESVGTKRSRTASNDVQLRGLLQLTCEVLLSCGALHIDGQIQIPSRKSTYPTRFPLLRVEIVCSFAKQIDVASLDESALLFTRCRPID